jgi:hypothetical protein
VLEWHERMAPVPSANVRAIKVPDGLTDEQTLFLSDIFKRRKGVLYGDARDPARRMARISG